MGRDEPTPRGRTAKETPAAADRRAHHAPRHKCGVAMAATLEERNVVVDHM